MPKIIIAMLLMVGLIGSPQAVILKSQMHKEATCLADNLWFEARGESREGQIAIAEVVRNRVLDKRFPNTYCGVIKQRKRRICQFSWYCSRPLRTKANHRYTREYKAILALSMNFINHARIARLNAIKHGFSRGALYYHSDQVKYEKLGLINRTEYLGKIGNHHFYK